MGHAASACQKSFSRVVTNCQEKIATKSSSKDERVVKYGKHSKESSEMRHNEVIEFEDYIICENSRQCEALSSREERILPVDDGSEISFCKSDTHLSRILGEIEAGSETGDDSYSICRKFSTRSKSVAFEKYILSNRSASDLESPTESEDICTIYDRYERASRTEEGRLATCCIELIDNFNADVINSSNKAVEGKSDDPVAVLERKQENILARLEKLKATVAQLQKRYGQAGAPSGQPKGSRSPTVTTALTGTTDFGDVVHDVVINADPEKIPLSLFVLSDLLQEKYKFKGTTHIHSSVSTVPDKLKSPFIKNGNKAREDRSLNQMIITLIWKKVSQSPEMMVSAHNQTPIQGEGNIARYLARLLDPQYESDICRATQMDEWIDMAMVQILNGNSKERAASLRSLNSRLGSNDWLVGPSISLADIVVWSSLHQTNQTSDVPANIKKWLTACNQSSVFARVKSFSC